MGPVGERPVGRLLARLQSPIALALTLLVPLALLRAVLMIDRRVPMGHDTFQYLHLQYVFFNEAALHGSLPQWLPFMTQGTVSNVWILVTQGIVASSVAFAARALEHVNFLWIFHAGFLFDEFVLLIGCLLLARRYFNSLAAVLFVAVSVTYTAITSTQPWYDFHLFYLLPLILYSLDRAIREASAFHLFLSGLFFAATLLGNLPYFLPVTAFAIVLFWAAMYAFMPGETREAFRALYRRRSWRHLAAVLVPVCLMIGFGMYLRAGWSEIISSNIGRGPRGEVATVAEFLTYGGSINLAKFWALVAPYSGNLDNTVYAGLLILPFALAALLARPSPVAVAFGATALALALFGAGTMLSVAFYHFFPLGDYFRHIGLTATVAKVFLVFFAGFGFDVFWKALTRGQAVSWFERPPQERRALIVPALAMAAMLALLLAQDVGWHTVFRFPAWAARTVNQLYLDPDQFSQALHRHLLLSAAFLGLLLTVLLLAVRRSRWVLGSAALLLTVHVADVLLVKAELEFRRVPRVDRAVVELFEPYRYQFANERSQDYYGNERFAALAPVLLGETPLVDAGRRPHPGVGPYGALYWSTESFLFFDVAASVFRTDHWLNSIDAFYRAWIPLPSQLPRHLGLPIPQSPAYAKLSGLGHPKLQVFSAIHILPSEHDVEELLASRGFSGDIVLAATQDALSVNRETPVVVEVGGDGPPGNADERLRTAAVSVEEFNFDTLRVRITVDSPAILYYADAWHPAWRAFVNGAPAPVIRTNLGYKSVPVPQGVSEVHFRFGSPAVEVLLRVVPLTGLLTLLAVLSLAATDARSRRMLSVGIEKGREAPPRGALDEGAWSRRSAAREGFAMPAWLRRLSGRGAGAFAATSPLWWLYARERHADDVWAVVRLLDPTSLALVGPAFTLLATGASLLLALLTLRVRDGWYLRGLLLVGFLVDAGGLFLLGWSSGPARLLVALHLAGLVTVWIMAARQRMRLVSLAGAALLAYAWIGQTVDACQVPGRVLAIEQDAVTSSFSALTASGDGFKRYPVPLVCYESASDLIPQLAEENFEGYNIIRVGERFFGIRRDDGPFSLERFRTGGFQNAVEGQSLAEVRRLILKVAAEEVQLVEENYLGFNVIEYRGRFYAIPQGEGAFDVGRVKQRAYSISFEGASVADVKRQIEAARKRGVTPGPRLAEEGFYGFNIVRYGDRFYAIPQGEGDFDIDRVNAGDYTRSFVGSSMRAVKRLIIQSRTPSHR